MIKRAIIKKPNPGEPMRWEGLDANASLAKTTNAAKAGNINAKATTLDAVKAA